MRPLVPRPRRRPHPQKVTSHAIPQQASHSACRRSPPHPRRRPTVTAALAPRLALAAAVATPALYAWWLRPAAAAWGATGEMRFPATNSSPTPCSTTMATTLPAPPSGSGPGWSRWAWAAAAGTAGDWLDNHRAPSADRIVAQWQHLEEGQRLNSMPNGRNWMTVAALEPNRTLVLRSTYQWPSGRTVAMGSGPLPWAYTDAIWGFHLRPAAGGRRRLVARTRARGHPRPLTWLFNLLLDEPLHFSMQMRQFHNLRTRVGRQR